MKNSDKKQNIILIPARSGSKRIPGKNIRPLDGIPLLAYSILSAQQINNIDGIYVSSDSEEYLKIAKNFGAQVIMRSERASSDTADMLLVVQDALQSVSIGREGIIIILLPTTPFRTISMILNAINQIYKAGKNATSLRSVEEMTESAWKCFSLVFGPYLVPICNSMDEANLPNQMVRKTYRGNGYVDIVKVSQVEKGDLWGDRCIGFITPKVIEIDCEDDFRYAEWWVKNRIIREEVIFR